MGLASSEEGETGSLELDPGMALRNLGAHVAKAVRTSAQLTSPNCARRDANAGPGSCCRAHRRWREPVGSRRVTVAGC